MFKHLTPFWLWLALSGLAVGEETKAPATDPGPLVVEDKSRTGAKTLVWLATSLERIYPNSNPGGAKRLELLAGRNGQISFQACLRNDREAPLQAVCSVEGGEGLQEQYINPSFETDCADLSLPAGDGYVVYPGPDGQVIDSIRWEVFAESLQDYATLQTAGLKPDDPRLGEIKTYADFPKSEVWIQQTLERVLKAPAKPPTMSEK